MRVSEVISTEEMATWTKGKYYYINAGCGAGKSFFIRTKLYEKAKAEGKKILVLVNRKKLKEQWIEDIIKEEKLDVIKVLTYQKYSYMLLHGYKMKDEESIDNFDYIVSDEIHSSITDSSYNSTFDLVLNLILQQKNKINIMLSATGKSVIKYLKEYKNIDVKEYFIPRDSITKNVDSLWFYKDDETPINRIKNIIKIAKEKGEIKCRVIMFCESAKKAYQLHKEFEQDSIFVCSENNDLYERVNVEAVEKMLAECKFEKQILFTTKTLDTGINIIDETLKLIICDIEDIDTLTQCVGRKRSIDANDKISLLIKHFNNNRMGGRITQNNKKIAMANYLKENGTIEFLRQYPRQIDYAKIIYDDITSVDNQTYDKKVNDLMMFKINEDNILFQSIIDRGKNGYKYYIKDLFNMNYYIDLEEEKKNNELEEYLKNIKNKKLFKEEREELIKKIGLKDKYGKIQKSVKQLNAYLEENKFNKFSKDKDKENTKTNDTIQYEIQVVKSRKYKDENDIEQKEELHWIVKEVSKIEINNTLETYLLSIADKPLFEEEQKDLFKMVMQSLIDINNKTDYRTKKLKPSTLEFIIREQLELPYAITQKQESKTIDGKKSRKRYIVVSKIGNEK